jgi:hypothetical protein
MCGQKREVKTGKGETLSIAQTNVRQEDKLCKQFHTQCTNIEEHCDVESEFCTLEGISFN